MATAKKSDKTTAELQAELDALLTWFESSELDVDEAVVKYEQGLELIKQIEERLKIAENTVQKLAQSFDKASIDEDE